MSAPRVLVADDSPVVLRMIETLLAREGLAVLTATDGISAIEQAFSQDVSLVILDVMMPRMNGYQACRLLKSEPLTRNIPVVILTSKDQAGDRFWGLETGADYYITKDANPQRILDLVKNILSADGGVAKARPPEATRTSVDILSRVNHLLDRKLYEATILSEIGRVARSHAHFDEAFPPVMGLVRRVLDCTFGAMAFVEGEDVDLMIALHRPTSPVVVEEAKSRILRALTENGGGTVTNVRMRVFPPEGAAQAREEMVLGGFASFPITTGQHLSGLLAMAGKNIPRMDAETQAFLGQVAHQAHVVMENSRLVERLRNLSVRDGLTDLYNHRHSIEQLAVEFHRAGRYEGGVCVIMVDIDHFKLINDSHGHQAGDIVIREIARILKDRLRTVDVIGRYGGEEFIAVLPHTSHEEARQTAERLRRAVQEHVFRASDKDLSVTVSVGVAAYPKEGIDSPSGLLREADRALYRAKEAGRNRVG